MHIAGHPKLNLFRKILWKISSKNIFKVVCPSEELKKFPRRFYTESKYWLDVLQQDYEIIYNYVYEKNWLSLKWLQLCGFKPVKKVNGI